jgi:hypothetical protein
VTRKRVISGVVMVMGPPRAIWSSNSGTTDPREPMTLPYLTHTNRVAGNDRLAEISRRSINALVRPITFTGLQALSVEIPTTAST